jgi:hypothetical protein
MGKKKKVLADDQIIAQVGKSLFDMALGDIHRSLSCDFPKEIITEKTVLKDGECLLGALIQCCCLIEAAGHYAFNKSNSSAAFTAFAGKFLRQYNKDELYMVLRCGLIHEYAPKNNKGDTNRKYLLVKNAQEHHLKEVPDQPDYLFFNVNSFIEHVDAAIRVFLKEVQNEKKQKQTILKRVSSHGLMVVHPITVDSISNDFKSCITLSDSASSVRSDDRDFLKTITNTVRYSISDNLPSLLKPKSRK